jgi:hypothetical protein
MKDLFFFVLLTSLRERVLSVLYPGFVRTLDGALEYISTANKRAASMQTGLVSIIF